MGFELSAFIDFLRQLGLAVAGAAALWGLVFSIYADRKKETTDHVVFSWIANRLKWLCGGGFVLAFLGWIFSGQSIFAHEGIVIIPSTEEVSRAFALVEPLYLVWAFVTILGLFIIRERNASALKYFFIVEFIIIAILISLPAWTGAIDRAQLFFIGHGFHSIFTVGTVLVLDFLFLSSKSSALLKQNIFPFFPVISKVIWVGLGIDFLSVALVFNEAIALTPKFFFMQTVVGILIVNGAILSGPITKMMLNTVKKEGKPLSKKQVLAADIAGTISITSWLSITFVDFFHHTTLSYLQFLFAYLIIILVLFSGHRLWEHFDKDEPDLSYS